MRTRILWFAALAAVLAAGCEAKVEGPKPSLASVTPQAVCTEQRTTDVTVAGDALSPLASKTLTEGPQLLLPKVTLTRQLDIEGADMAGEPLPLPDDPADPAASAVRWLSQKELSFQVRPEARWAPGLYTLTVQNAAGESATLDRSLLMVPPPSVTQVEPEVVCDAADSSTTLTGDFFIQVGDEFPKVGFRAPGAEPKIFVPRALEDCRPLPGTAGLKACRQAVVAIPKGELAPGNYAVEVQNPTPVGCDSHGGAPGTSGQIALTVVPRPALLAVEPDVVCTAEGENALLAKGEDFVRYDGKTPSLLLGTAALATQGKTCEEVPLESLFAGRRKPLERCTELTATLAKDGLAPGLVAAKVRNPEPVAVETLEPVDFLVVPPPAISSVEPDLVCTAEGGVPVVVKGTGFLTIDSAVPEVFVGETKLTPVPEGCSAVDGPVETVKTCTELKLTLPEELAFETFAVVVRNPQTAACSSTETVSLVNLGKPVITAVKPGELCSEAPGTVVLEGDGFLIVDGEAPSVTVSQGATSKAYTPTPDPEFCSTIRGITETAKKCTRLTIQIAAGDLPASGTAYDVKVTNPAPADCSGTATARLLVSGPPTLASVAPQKICSGGTTLTLTGTSFQPGAKVTLAGIAATEVRVESATLAHADFAGGLPVADPPGTKVDVVLQNASGCSATLAAAVEIISGPALFFADPSIVFNGVSVQATFYGRAFTGGVNSLQLRPSGATSPVIDLTPAYDTSKPNRVLATIPAGTQPGLYDVLLGDNTACKAVLEGGLRVVAETNLSLKAMEPAFGAEGTETAVVVKADPAVAGGLKAVPRAYLNPRQAGGSTLAKPLTSVAFQDAGSLTAIVPALAPGEYDLIVVNPPDQADPEKTGVGFLARAFTVTPADQPPPTISGLSPASIAGAANAKFSIKGADFRDPKVTLSCVEGATGSTPVEVTSGTISNASATSLDYTFDASVFGYAACVVRVTDQDNGTFADFSALVITNPSQKLSAFANGPELNVGRRALSAVSGRVTPVARFLYAIGGDDGTDAGALDSVESTPVDLYGKPSGWSTQVRKLTTKRSFAGAAVVGRFIYVAGGFDGAQPLNTVERAYILDPAARTDFDDLELKVQPGAGLAQGVYYYRVSAVMASSDPVNPEGETLPSDSFGLMLPKVPEGNAIQVQLTWARLPGAAGYRVYRTEKPGDAPGTEKLLGTTTGGDALTLLDDGSKAPSGDSPLPIGSTGVWTQVATMGAARRGLSVAAAADPADPAKVYLYAVGGKDAAGAALKSFEYLPITLQSSGAQVVPAAFVPGTLQLPNGRWQAGAFAVDSKNSMVGAGEAYLYVGPGVAANGTTLVSDFNVAKVLSGGQLAGTASATAWDAAIKSAPNRAGYGTAIANGFLYLFGGGNASPATNSSQAQICHGSNCQGTGAPFLDSASNATQMNKARYLMGSTLESAFIYIIGGTAVEPSGPVAATKTIEMTIW